LVTCLAKLNNYNSAFGTSPQSLNLQGVIMLKKLIKTAVAAAVLSAGAAHAVSVLDTATYGGHTYSLLTQATWTDSETFAQSIGGHLVSVNDAAENVFLNNTWGSTKTLWIGLQRTGPGPTNFAWANGDALTYTNWAGGEPNNAGGSEDYVHTYSNGTWNDLPNNSSYLFPQFGVVETVSVSAVPEPESYALMLAGLGLMGSIARRRKSKLA